MPLETIITSDSNTFDVLIIGAGPAGLSACIYLARANLKVGFIEKNIPGGKIVDIQEVNNYPGFSSISGSDLALNLYKQAIELKAQYIFGEVSGINKKLGYHVVYTTDGNIRYAKAIIIATGISNNKLNVEGEEQYLYKGVSTCAICDGALAKNKDIAIVGDDEEATEAFKYLSNIANKIYWISNLNIPFENQNTEILPNYKLHKIEGNGNEVTSISIKNNSDIKKLNVAFVFTFNGNKINNSILPKEIKIEDGIIIVDDKKQTNIPGIFAIGDITRINNRQIILAISDGTQVGLNVINYVRNWKQ